MEQPSSNVTEILEDMDKNLEKGDGPKLVQEKINTSSEDVYVWNKRKGLNKQTQNVL